MKRIQRSALLPFPVQQIYDLVSDVESYPDFLPWCESASILSLEVGEMIASMDVRRGGISERITTHSRLVSPQSIQMKLVEGPFTELIGVWTFKPLGGTDGSSSFQGCKAEFDVQYEFSRALLGHFLGSFFTKGVNNLMDAFCRRAEFLYSGRNNSGNTSGSNSDGSGTHAR